MTFEGITVGMYFTFQEQRWRVTAVNDEDETLMAVCPSSGEENEFDGNAVLAWGSKFTK